MSITERPQLWEDEPLIQSSERKPATGYVVRLMPISPDHANRLGIPAEAPVFVATNDNEVHHCEGCGEDYPPTIYQAGYVLTDGHVECSPGPGGFCIQELPHNVRNQSPLMGYHDYEELDGDDWFAVVEPVGRVDARQQKDSYGNGYTTMRVEGIRVVEIFPFCQMRGVYVPNGTLYGDGRFPEFSLSEFCGFEKHRASQSFQDRRPRWNFRARNKGVAFTQAI